MKTRNLVVYMMLIGAIVFYSCSDDDKDPVTTQVTVQLNNPAGISSATYSDISVTLTNRSTGQETLLTGLSGNILSIEVADGSYNITLSGDISYTIDGVTKTSQVRAYKESVAIAGGILETSFDLFIYEADKADFVIKEIFFTGSLTPEGQQTFDQYFIIHNNSDETLYADRLFLASSAFMTVTKENYTPDIMNEAFSTDAMIMVPGSGTEHPVAPQESFIIAVDGVNHKEINPNGIDLSNADFEIIFPAESGMTDIDNPDVPNMLNIVDRFLVHNRGFKSYALGRLGADTDNFLANYKYLCTWVFKFEEWSFDMDAEYYKIPNEWILDAVNLSVESEFQWIVTSPSLDMGWTYCGTVDKDPNRYGKSVQRKVAGKTQDGKDILLDTNNSKFDFTPEATPSLKDQ